MPGPAVPACRFSVAGHGSSARCRTDDILAAAGAGLFWQRQPADGSVPKIPPFSERKVPRISPAAPGYEYRYGPAMAPRHAGCSA